MKTTFEIPQLEDNLKLDELEIPEGISRIILYHGTTSKFKDDVLSNGLRSKNETGNSVYDGTIASDGELVYLARKEVAEGAASRALEKFGGDRMVIAVEVDIDNLTEDEDVRKIWGIEGWRESLRLNGTCAYKGPVNHIKSLTIYEGDSYTKVKEILLFKGE